MEVDTLMPWVRFIKPFDFWPTQRSVMAYGANSVHLVKKACADKAIAQGCAVLTERPQVKREEDASGQSKI